MENLVNKILMSSLLVGVLSANAWFLNGQETATTLAAGVLNTTTATANTNSTRTVPAIERMAKSIAHSSWYGSIWCVKTLYTHPATICLLATATAATVLAKSPRARQTVKSALYRAGSATYNYLKDALIAALTPAPRTAEADTQTPDIIVTEDSQN